MAETVVVEAVAAVNVRITGGKGASDPTLTMRNQNVRQRPQNSGNVQENNGPEKEEAIEVMGKVVEKFKAGMFSIELDAGKTVLATMAGRLRRNRIKIMNGDKVSLEMSPYDLTKGRITYRHK